MILRTGNVLDSGSDILLFTSNNVLNSKGELVMGRGNAREFKQKFPYLPLLIGDSITKELYGCVIFLSVGLGCFQTKKHWRQPSTLEIIKFSTEYLINWIDDFEFTGNIAMPFPGIGNGGLSKDEVIPIISSLPDNVEIYTLENS